MNNKKTASRMGRPLIGSTVANKSLGGVRVTDDQLASYGAAADTQDQARSDWIRATLDKAAAKALKGN